MNRSRLIYLAILGVALVVLFWDKFANPNSVTEPQAGQAQTSLPTATTAQEDVSQWANSPFVRRVLNQQKQQAADFNDDTSRDLFVPSELFRKEVNGHTNNQENDPLDTELRLTSVSKGSDQDHVLINGNVVRIGETIGRYRLIIINRDEVVLHVGTEHITLPIGNLTSPETRRNVKITTCNLSDCYSN